MQVLSQRHNSEYIIWSSPLGRNVTLSIREIHHCVVLFESDTCISMHVILFLDIFSNNSVAFASYFLKSLEDVFIFVIINELITVCSQDNDTVFKRLTRVFVVITSTYVFDPSAKKQFFKIFLEILKHFEKISKKCFNGTTNIVRVCACSNLQYHDGVSPFYEPRNGGVWLIPVSILRVIIFSTSYEVSFIKVCID